MMRILFVMLVFVAHLGNLSAGTFRHLGVKDGLSSRQVFQITKDSTGYIWLFTRMGVDRYDGNEIRHYKLDETLEAKDHILSFTVMTCDRKGNIWIMLKNGKIYSYDKQTDAFILRIDITQLLPSQSVELNDMLFDHDNSLWLCLTTGIYHYNMKEERLTQAALSGECVYSLIEAADGNFFAGTSANVFHLYRTTGSSTFSSVKRMEFPIRTRVESLCLFHNKLYVGTFSDGVFAISLVDEKVTSLRHITPSVPIRSMVSIGDNEILIATDGSGVYRLNATNDGLTNRYLANEDDERSLSGNTVSDIFVDEHNCIWISTNTNGVSCLDSNNPDIQWIRHGHNNQNSLVSSHVNVLLEDSEGDMWYGTNNGVSLYETKTGKWTHFLNDRGDNYTHSSVVITLCEDSQKSVWAGGYGIGAYRINKRTKMAQKVKHRSGNDYDGLTTNYIYSVYADGDDVWLGGIEGDLTRFNTRTGQYMYYPFDCVGDIKAGKDGYLLLACCSGLAVFNKADGNVTWHQAFGDVSLHYPIRCLLQSSAGDIWLATGGDGLIRYNLATNQSDVLTMVDGLDSNNINSLVEGNDNHIWFNTEKNLYCLDVAKRKVISMNEFLEINWGYYNPNASICLRNGNIAFGTAGGALVFSPYFDFEMQEKIKLIFTDLKLLYQSVRAGVEGSLLEQAINETSVVNLGYTQNSFSISFSSINFVFPHKVRYEYKLENFNDEWLQTSTAQSIDYMNLSPGKYIFRLKAIDTYTQENIGERSMEIIICKPFWASNWALFLYFVLIGILVFLVVQFVRNKVMEYNSREKLQAFIQIAHDIRTPITLIKAPLSELETMENLSEHTRKSISLAVKNAERLFGMVTKLLDLQKADLHPEKLTVSRQDIYGYMEEKMMDFRMAAIQKGLELSLKIAPNFPFIWFDRDQMNKIMDNLLSNALKYTEEGSITVIVKFSRSKWTVEVKDTGIGIPRKDQKYLFGQFFRAENAIKTGEKGSGIGLLFVRRMIKQHRGRISFSSTENVGTSFILTFPQKIKSSAVAKESPKVLVLQEEKRAVQVSSKKNVLLLAEDDEDMREYLTSSLSQEYKVVSVSDGGKALEQARLINPDIIISDITMPVLQGDELCRVLKSSMETSHIPIILLTALSERENIIQGLEAGANDYIIKPFDFSVLKVRIRNILQSRQYLRERVLSSEVDLQEIDYNSQLDKEFLSKAVMIIEKEMANTEFSVSDLCSMLAMSRTSVYNKMKTLTDQSPNDFMRIIRLNKAKELLTSRRFTVGEVSCMVGFSNPKYFSTSFKKQFGVIPSKF